MNKIKLTNSAIYPLLCRIINIISLLSKYPKGTVDIGNRTLLRKCKFFVQGNNNKVIINKYCRLKNCCIYIYGNNNHIEIEDKVMIYEQSVMSIKGDNCIIHIGAETTIGSASFFLEESNTSIEIGEDCMLGRKICIQTTDFHSIIDMNTQIRLNPPSNVYIGNHVWIGYGVTIGKGSKINNDSVVGEHSLVTKQFSQKNICIAGIPANIIKENINWSRKKL